MNKKASKSVDIESLKKKAVVFRKGILHLTHSAGSGHPGGSLSAVEILISLYDYKMHYDPKNPQWEERDRLIISKGHITPAAYVALAHYGYFPEKELEGYRKFGSKLQGHVYRQVPGIEFSTGSLGHGLSVANGLALAARMKKKDYYVYCLLGDGEIQEGSIWEAAMTASHYKIDHVCAIVDYNKIQENGLVEEIKNVEPLAKKWESFGWRAIEIDGHDFKEVIKALDSFTSQKGKPCAIIAHTTKGKGISFMEKDRNWHGKAPDAKQLKDALTELE